MAIITTAAEAVKAIKSGDVLAINGFGAMCYADDVAAALEKQFLETGSPRGLTLWFAAGAHGRGTRTLNSRLAYEGLLKKAIGGHWDGAPELAALVAAEKVEAYNLPQGVITHLYRAAAGRKPVITTEIGLKTFIDPRLESGRLNQSARDQLVSLRLLDGKEYLEYKTPRIDVALIRGTTADAGGNISMEKEAVFLDILSIAQAAKANGGIVIAQVERLSAARTHPKQVKVPGVLVDYIVLAPEQRQTRVEVYNPAYSGELLMPGGQIKEHNKKLAEMVATGYTPRALEDWIIARRAALEMKPNSVINLGIGIPAMIGAVADAEGVAGRLTMTVEAGTLGGVPASGGSFGATINPEIIYDQAYQFDFYDGGNLDTTFVGAMQIDKQGNVNVSKINTKVVGVGGFVNITQTSKKLVYCTTFMGGKGFAAVFADGKLSIRSEGQFSKFVDQVAQVSYSGENAINKGQEVLYVTERCVFRLTPDGLTLTELAPGIDLEQDILANMSFKPIISPEMKLMDARCFVEGSLGLKENWAV